MKSENSENSRDIDAARILPLLMNWKCGGEVALNRYFVSARETFADWADAHQISNTEILLANELAMAVLRAPPELSRARWVLAAK